MTRNKPLVAIYCLVYNHGEYLRECLDGFVNQKTDFPVVAIVHDDKSTDNSADIIREYCKKYPHLFHPIYEEENQYSKHNGSIERVMNAAIEEIKPTYLAFCEGDDYWTDPNKLQKQVDVLEQHPEYVFCCHRYKIFNEQDRTFSMDYAQDFYKDGEDLVVTPEIQSRTWVTKLLSMVARADLYMRARYTAKEKYGDTCLDLYEFYELMKYGNGISLNRFMGVYRLQQNGIWTSQDYCAKTRTNYEICKNIWSKNLDDPNIRYLFNNSAITYARQLNCLKASNWKIFNEIYHNLSSFKYKIKAIIVYILPLSIRK